MIDMKILILLKHQHLLSESLNKKEVEFAAERERWREAAEFQCRFDESFQGSSSRQMLSVCTFLARHLIFLNEKLICTFVVVIYNNFLWICGQTLTDRTRACRQNHGEGLSSLMSPLHDLGFQLTPPLPSFFHPNCAIRVVGFEGCFGCSCWPGSVGERKRENPCLP